MLFLDNQRKVPSVLPTVTINDSPISYVNSFCYLGVNLDTKLRFQTHLQSVMSKLNHKMLLLCKIRSFIDSRSAVLIYKAHLLSLIEYGSIFLDGLPLNQLNKLQRVQNKCLRICHLADKTTSNVALHCMSKLLPLRLRRKLSVCKIIFKKIRHSPGILREPVRSGNRSSFKRIIQLPIPRLNRFKASLPYAGYLNWNQLPENLRMITDYDTFKRFLNKYMYNKFCEDGLL